MDLADAHVHFFRQGFQTRYGVFFPNEGEIAFYEGIREVHRIGAVLAVGYEGEHAYLGNNRYLAELAAGRPWLHPLAYLHAETPPSIETLNRYREERFAGVSLYLTDTQRAESVARWPGEVIAALNEHRAIVSINIPCPLLSTAAPFLEKVEGCRVLISHLGLSKVQESSQAAELLRPLTALARLPHVGVKASAFYAHGKDWHNYPHPEALTAFSVVAEAFGTGRLYWGSDFSPALEYVSIPQTIEVIRSHPNLNEAEKTAILCGNLRRLLNV